MSRAALDRNFRPNAVLPDDFARCCSGKRPPCSGKSSALNRKSAGRRARRTPLPFPAVAAPSGAARPFQISKAHQTTGSSDLHPSENLATLKRRWGESVQPRGEPAGAEATLGRRRVPPPSAELNAALRFSGPWPHLSGPSTHFPEQSRGHKLLRQTDVRSGTMRNATPARQEPSRIA